MKKEVANLGVPWEEGYGYSQAVKIGDFLFVSGQLSHDEDGEFIGANDFEKQYMTTYSNLKKVLSKFDFALNDIVYETVWIKNLEKHGDKLSELHSKQYENTKPASNVIGVEKLFFPEQLIEVSVIAHR